MPGMSRRASDSRERSDGPRRVYTMTSRRSALSFTIASMIFTVWSACWGQPVTPRHHRPHHRKVPQVFQPAQPATPTDRPSARPTGPRAQKPEDGTGAPITSDRGHRADEMKKGERSKEAQKSGAVGERVGPPRVGH